MDIRLAKVDSSEPKRRKVAVSKTPFAGSLEITFYRTGRNGDEELVSARSQALTNATHRAGSILLDVSEGDNLTFFANLEVDAPTLYATALLTETRAKTAKDSGAMGESE